MLVYHLAQLSGQDQYFFLDFYIAIQSSFLVAPALPLAGGWKYLMEPRNRSAIGPQTTNTGSIRNTLAKNEIKMNRSEMEDVIA